MEFYPFCPKKLHYHQHRGSWISRKVKKLILLVTKNNFRNNFKLITKIMQKQGGARYLIFSIYFKYTTLEFSDLSPIHKFFFSYSC